MTDEMKLKEPTINPITGEVVDTVKEAAIQLEQLREYMYELKSYEAELRRLIADYCPLCPGSFTTYVSCDDMRIKVVRPSPTWDHATLKRLWNSDIAKRYLRIEKVSPNLREIKKLQKEHGGEAFLMLKEEILGCQREATGLPTIYIERDQEK